MLYEVITGDRNKLESGEVLIENCNIHHFGVWNRTYAEGIEIKGVGTTIRNCKLTDAPHSAINFKGNNHRITSYNVCYTKLLRPMYGLQRISSLEFSLLLMEEFFWKHRTNPI